jgi:hypothetical protein
MTPDEQPITQEEAREYRAVLGSIYRLLDGYLAPGTPARRTPTDYKRTMRTIRDWVGPIVNPRR